MPGSPGFFIAQTRAESEGDVPKISIREWYEDVADYATPLPDGPADNARSARALIEDVVALPPRCEWWDVDGVALRKTYLTALTARIGWFEAGVVVAAEGKGGATESGLEAGRAYMRLLTNLRNARAEVWAQSGDRARSFDVKTRYLAHKLQESGVGPANFGQCCNFWRLWIKLADHTREFGSSHNPPFRWVWEVAQNRKLRHLPERILKGLEHWSRKQDMLARLKPDNAVALAKMGHLSDMAAYAMPPKVAMRLAEMPLAKRLVGLSVACAMSGEGLRHSERTAWTQEFWARFQVALRGNWRQQAVEWLCTHSDLKDIGRAVSIMLPGTDPALANHIAHALLAEERVGAEAGLYLRLRGFSPVAFAQVRAYLENRYYLVDQYALRLARQFGKQSLQWLAANKKLNRSCHDATYFLPECRKEGLAAFLFKRAQAAPSDLEIICSKWEQIPAEKRELPVSEICAWVAAQKYVGAQSAEFAQEAARHGVSDWAYRDYEARWMKSQSVPPIFNTDLRFKAGGLTGRFLPRNDPRGLFLGQHTNCCQHPDGVGKACAWHGQEDEKGGFFVVENHYGAVRAQSWTWVSRHGVCFDNIETLTLGDQEREDVETVYRQAAKWITSQFGGIVTVGTGDVTFGSHVSQNLVLIGYGGYTDSSYQRLVAESGDAFIWGVPLPAVVPPSNQVIVRAATEADLPDCQEIANIRYPEGWRNVEPGDWNMVAVDSRGRVQGYLSVDTEEREVTDLACHIGRRGVHAANALVASLTDLMRRMGGEWVADCRASTSYRLLRAFETRGRIRVTRQEPQDSMNGERMTRLYFQLT